MRLASLDRSPNTGPCRGFVRACRRIALIALAGPVMVAAQNSAPMQYPATRTVNQVDDYHGVRVADPYRWLEDIDSPEVKAWVVAQNRVTADYLARLPNREQIKARLTALWNYPRVSIPFWEGGHWFYTRNSGLQRQGVVYTRRQTLDGPERMLRLDPDRLSPDGSIALSHFSPAPDGKRYAYGQSEGGSDWATGHSGASRRDRTPPIPSAGSSSPVCRGPRTATASSTPGIPRRPKAKRYRPRWLNQTLYYHVLGTPQSADIKITRAGTIARGSLAGDSMRHAATCS